MTNGAGVSPVKVYREFGGQPEEGWQAEHAVAERIRAAVPQVGVIARNNRGFMHQVVRHLVREHGVRQFLDVGAGLPHSPNVHEVAQAEDPGARVVYVDRDPAVVARLDGMGGGTPQGRVATLVADAREPGSIFGSEAVRDVLDLSQPIGLLFISVTLFVPDEDDPGGIIAGLAAPLPPGSFFAHNAGTYDYDTPAAPTVARLVDAYAAEGMRAFPRSADRTRAFLEGAGLEILAPGIVPSGAWHLPAGDPRPDPGESCVHAVLARRP
ncbi:hypothetical protein ACZ90_70240 [Streptomyces albus subsp. albus]|nr:hypothetical protein ACZ90_70240 [Streptomyces albus subsp. albus]